jgi:ABC-type phosphate transport system ATPase subunit
MVLALRSDAIAASALSVHKSGLRVKLVEKRIFDRANIGLVFDGVSPNPRDFPNIDLSICDNIASGRREMTIHTRAYSVDRLPDIDRHLVEIAKYVTANLVREARTALRRKARSIAISYSAAIRSEVPFALSSGSSSRDAMCLTTGTQTPSPQTW